jgi:YVTN family beta-propeller protein
VTTIAGADRIAVIALNGAASSVVASVTTGQLGTIQYTYGVSSGIALSPDGLWLAVCISFTDELQLIDTTTNTIITNVPVGDFPVRASWAPDGSRVYVTNAFGDSLSVVNVAGAASAVIATIPGIEFPLNVDVDPSGQFAYVSSFDFSTPEIAVVDTGALLLVGAVPLVDEPYATWYSPADAVLYVTTTGGHLVRVAAAGAGSTVLDTEILVGNAADMVFSESLRRAYAAQPGLADGIDVVAYGGIYLHYGAGLAGTGGVVPRIEGLGVPTLGATVTIEASDGLANTFGLLMLGFAPAAVPVFGGILYVVPDRSFFHVLAPGGTFALPVSVPGSPIFLGLDVFLQSAYVDAGAPGGVSHSDGLAMLIR